MTVVTSTPIELAALLKSETAKWGPIIKEAVSGPTDGVIANRMSSALRRVPKSP